MNGYFKYFYCYKSIVGTMPHAAFQQIKSNIKSNCCAQNLIPHQSTINPRPKKVRRLRIIHNVTVLFSRKSWLCYLSLWFCSVPFYHYYYRLLLLLLVFIYWWYIYLVGIPYYKFWYLVFGIHSKTK